MTKPAFLITIDTEGDNLWQNHDRITTENTRFLPRFQALCEKYAFKPVYLTNYEMAMDPAYVEFARDVIARGVGEVGMHLHAWNSPPLTPLTDDDWRHKPYLIEYPTDQIRAKVDHMTKLLEDAFQTKMLSHRAGRWAFNEYYASLLLEYGYQVDCSVDAAGQLAVFAGQSAGQRRHRLHPVPVAGLFHRSAEHCQTGRFAAVGSADEHSVQALGADERVQARL